MGSNDRRDEGIDALLRELTGKGVFEERLGDALASDIEADTRERRLSAEREAKLLEAVDRGMVDGRVARARARMRGTLGGFGSALRRIREEAGISLTAMAGRAGMSSQLWEEVETQRRRPETLTVSELASVVEAAQLRLSETADALRRSRRLRLLPGGEAAFRADEGAVSDSMAAYEDLLAAAADQQEAQASRGGHVDPDLDELVGALRRELQRRGREDLL
jgi:transcriptional regulator with XRE-family HTH domain